MRLIYADDVKNMLFNTYDKEKDVISSYWVAGTLADKIDEVQTAYDVDKVVEHLGKDGKNTDVCIRKKRAIEIVKAGGIDVN